MNDPNSPAERYIIWNICPCCRKATPDGDVMGDFFCDSTCEYMYSTSLAGRSIIQQLKGDTDE